MNQRWRQYFGWSKSRAGLFRECKKRYSFQYIFKFERSRPAKMAKVLSKIATLAILKGSLVHDEIETFWKAFRKTGTSDFESSKKRLTRAFDTLIIQAESKVLEARLGQMSLSETKERLEEDKLDGLNQLDSFFNDHWPRYQNLEIVCFEELERFQVGDHPVWVSADLVVRHEDGLLLVDWKTGKREQPASESEQLTAYLLWASERFGVPLENIAGELVWFQSGNVDRTTRVPSDLDDLKEVMAKDSEAMLALTSYDQIEASPAEKKCKRCNFLPLCEEGSEWMEDSQRVQILASLGV